MKKNLFKKQAATFFNIIGIMSIIWYLITFYNVINEWWAFPSLAVGSALLGGIVLPVITNRFKVAYAITEAGFAVLLYAIFNNPLVLFGILPFIAIMGNLFIRKGQFSYSTILVDICIGILSALFIMNLHSSFLLIIMLITYVITLILDVKFYLWKNHDKGGWIGDEPEITED